MNGKGDDVDIQVTDTQTVKVEEGDILLVTVPTNTSDKQLMSFRKSFTKQVKDMVGSDKVVVIVVAAEAGTVSMGLVKREELDDIRQRLDDLETAGDR